MCDWTGDWEQMHEARQDGTELVRGEERLQRGGSRSGLGQFDHDDGIGKGLLDDDDHGGDYGGQISSETALINQGLNGKLNSALVDLMAEGVDKMWIGLTDVEQEDSWK